MLNARLLYRPCNYFYSTVLDLKNPIKTIIHFEPNTHKPKRLHYHSVPVANLITTTIMRVSHHGLLSTSGWGLEISPNFWVN